MHSPFRVFLHQSDIGEWVKALRPLYQLEGSSIRYGARKYGDSVASSFAIFFIQSTTKWKIHCGGRLGHEYNQVCLGTVVVIVKCVSLIRFCTMCLAELELQQVSDKTHQPLCPNDIISGSDYNSCIQIGRHGWQSGTLTLPGARKSKADSHSLSWNSVCWYWRMYYCPTFASCSSTQSV